MAIITVCQEDSDIASRAGTVTWSTTAGTFNAGFGRGAFTISSALNNDDTPSHYIQTLQWPSAQSTFWLSFYVNTTAQFSNIRPLIQLLDSSGVIRLGVRSNNTTGALKLWKRNATATYTDLATSSSAIGTGMVRMDLYVDYRASGTMTLYVNGTQYLTYSGDLTTNDNTTLSQLRLSNASSATANFSEIVVATDDTRAFRIVTLTSSTAGNAQQWTGTATNVNQNSLVNDANFIYSTTANQVQQYKPGSLPSGVFVVRGLVMSARALKGAGGPQNMQYVTRIGSTDYTSASVTPAGSFTNMQNIQETNPGTSVAFTTADLADTNLQYGIKSIT